METQYLLKTIPKITIIYYCILQHGILLGFMNCYYCNVCINDKWINNTPLQ